MKEDFSQIRVIAIDTRTDLVLTFEDSFTKFMFFDQSTIGIEIRLKTFRVQDIPSMIFDVIIIDHLEENAKQRSLNRLRENDVEDAVYLLDFISSINLLPVI